ncbi:hypothetical protein H2201_002609 [Coniosporium apollinis]|uniref:Fe2OG dioxygenase domain-containing protein n=1 Tax=Coniosporium apollinis TaxID=61459 RepID=A0ABQ9NZJ3_9PEZI|nr:hypothetical protein H2201_002609 [Coniosporium apollinis]
MAPHKDLDAHERPPQDIRNIYKKYQKMKKEHLALDRDIIDISSGAQSDTLREVWRFNFGRLRPTFDAFNGSSNFPNSLDAGNLPDTIPIYEHPHIPGLQLIPNLLPPSVQPTLLNRLLHRDLSNPTHKTNIHTHYNIPYPASSSSFFTVPASSEEPFTPLDPLLHKPLPLPSFLRKKLRWMTLGGQYDWTAKEYPSDPAPPFPSDIAALLSALFPATTPEAAILNFYAPGDTLSMHRDVAESCGKGLVSISLGCDGIFVIGIEEEGKCRTVVVRLRSGDAVYMTGESRFAWHGVPLIVGGTCPAFLGEWPATPKGEGEDARAGAGEDGGGGSEDPFERWRGWMAGKRINLNVRQMFE